MHNESALLLRLHEHQQLATPLLLINPPDDPGIYHSLNIAGVLHDNYTQYTRWQNSDIPQWFDCHLPDDEFSERSDITVVLFLPKGKQRLFAHLQLLDGRVPAKTRLIVIGAVDAGIKSAGKKMTGYCGNVQKIDAARHCQAWSGNLQSLLPVKLESMFTTWSLKVRDNDFEIFSLPGVFSEGRLDSGSQLLADTLIAKPSDLSTPKEILDFGCGAGVLSIITNHLFPGTRVTAVDSDAFATKATEKTFQHNNIPGQIKPSAAPNDLSGRYHLIISNPPFHQGTSQTRAVTQAFIQQLPKLLAPKGQAWIVANRFLNYEDVAEQVGLKVVRAAENRAYKVLVID